MAFLLISFLSFYTIIQPSFSSSLETLQQQIQYKFKSPDLLRQAMTHPSFSLDNNHALSLLGLKSMEASAALSVVGANPGASPADVDAGIAKISSLDDCASAGERLALESLVRVARKTNGSSPSVLCGAFRAIFGAVAVDAGGLDAASEALWKVFGGGKFAF